MLADIEIRTSQGLITYRGGIECLDAEPVGVDGDVMHMDVSAYVLTVQEHGEVRMDGESPRPLLPGVYELDGQGLAQDGVPWI